jgi:hypothetical protein
MPNACEVRNFITEAWYVCWIETWTFWGIAIPKDKETFHTRSSSVEAETSPAEHEANYKGQFKVVLILGCPYNHSRRFDQGLYGDVLHSIQILQ